MPELVEISCAIKRKEVKRVAPSLADPGSHRIYWLSNLDQNVAVIMHTVCFYKANERSTSPADPVTVIQKALAEVLVNYYPLAGRLALSLDGKLQVICTGEGAVFIEAEADAKISGLGDDVETNVKYVPNLVYGLQETLNILDRPLLALQVTRFKCGGFSVGASMNHCMVDGLAASEFLISLGEIARGLPISIQPVLDRTLLKARDPVQIEFPHSEFAEIQTLQQANGTTQTSADDIMYSHVCFDSKTLSLLKKQILDEGIVKKCSSFEVLTACIWRTRTKALHMASSQMTKLLFAVDGRSRFCPPLPKGFHGNGIVFTCAMASAGELTNRKLSYAVGLVQEAIVMINDKYMRSAIDYFEQTRVRPSMTATLIITSWCRLPFLKADFGWGEAIHYCPVGLPQPEVAVFLADDKNSGVKVFLGLPSFAWSNIKSLLL